MRLRFFLVCFLLPWLLLNSEVLGENAKYDLAFKRWGEFYFAFEDWRWFKCQGMAESNLDPKALSWCGAMGIMQIMPATAKELGVKNSWEPEENIQGGIKYDKIVDRFFKGVTKTDERRKFMFAGYNAGMGNIQKAKKLANSNKWDDVSKSLCSVTGKHCIETIGYVKRIHEFKKRY